MGYFEAYMSIGIDILLQPVAWSDGLSNLISVVLDRKYNNTNI